MHQDISKNIANYFELIVINDNECAIKIQNNQNMNFPIQDLLAIQKDVFTYGCEAIIEIERSGLNDPNFNSFFKYSLFDHENEINIQLSAYRNLLAKIIEHDLISISKKIKANELSRLKHDIYYRLAIATAHEIFKIQNTKNGSVKSFYESLGFSESTADKFRRHGNRLQTYFLKNRHHIISKQADYKTANIGGSLEYYIDHISSILNFSYVSQLDELLAIENEKNRNWALSNPSIPFQIGSIIKVTPLSKLRCEDLTRIRKHLNNGRTIEDLTNKTTNSKIDENRIFSPKNNEKTEENNHSEIDIDVRIIIQKANQIFESFRAFVTKLQKSSHPDSNKIEAIESILSGFLHLKNEGYRHYQLITGPDQYIKEFEYEPFEQI